MTISEWIDQAKTHRQVLVSLLENYHPAMSRDETERLFTQPHLPITAPLAEQACQAVRERIKTDAKFQAISPVARFYEALEASDVGTIMTLLNQAWFGVPESSNCWRIIGFSEACDLLEDPPEEEEGLMIITDPQDAEKLQ